VILYLDTSCLVKLYVTEDHSSDAREWFEQSEATATSVVAFVEAAAAVTRRAREGHLRPDHASEALSRLAADWPAFVRVPVNEVAGAEVAQRHGLRAMPYTWRRPSPWPTPFPRWQ
jgi:predicted nucleic acid-binding protein